MINKLKFINLLYKLNVLGLPVNKQGWNGKFSKHFVQLRLKISKNWWKMLWLLNLSIFWYLMKIVKATTNCSVFDFLQFKISFFTDP